MSNEYILQMKQVVKQFPGVLALDKVDLDVKPAEVMAIIGENGAGKSTLMKIISGAFTADTGQVVLDGQVIPSSMKPKDRLDIGIAIIYQELNYLDEMTISENLFMGRTLTKGPLKVVNYKRMFEESKKLLKEFNMDYSPRTLMKSLSVAEKQMIEILRAVSKDVKVLIMDEPTSSLNEVETRRLFEFIVDLRAKGVSILYISHKLEEVFELADRVQVMRDGKNVGVRTISETDTNELVTLMVGREITDMYPKEDNEIGQTVLSVKNLSCHFAKNISFDVRKGEVLGLFGLVGSGRVEAMEGLLGIKGIDSGEITLEGEVIKIRNPIEAKGYGIGYIPSDRKKEGLVLINTVRNNLTVTVLNEVSRGGVLSSAKENKYSDTWIGKLGIKTPSRNTEIDSLSGGNQQKVVIAKWLLTNPKVLIMNDPTRGIDVGAKVEIYKVMEELCKEGISIIMVSSELPETMGITDRMVVFADGRVVAEMDRSDYNQKDILKLAVGGND
ncbi:MAG: sugar ABC transporter ATP-binding protein [Clostridia bacterium]|jgi:ABC-type sugar transport system ATPase subunit|nr:sugar ABC transporter ATP-binding protein [Clostridia bacterium]